MSAYGVTQALTLYAEQLEYDIRQLRIENENLKNDIANLNQRIKDLEDKLNGREKC